MNCAPTIEKCWIAKIFYQGPGSIGDGVAMFINMDGTVYINRTNLEQYVAHMPTTGARTLGDMALRAIAVSALHNRATFKTVGRAQADKIASASAARGDCNLSGGNGWDTPFPVTVGISPEELERKMEGK